MLLSTLAFASAEGGPCKTRWNGQDCDTGLICVQTKEITDPKNDEDSPNGVCKSMTDALTQRPSKNPDAKAVNALPDVSLEGGMTLAIKAMLRSAMYLTIIAIVVAAIYYIISRGKDEDMTKAKDIILYLVIGMAIIAAAYGIVSGVAQFNVFG